MSQNPYNPQNPYGQQPQQQQYYQQGQAPRYGTVRNPAKNQNSGSGLGIAAGVVGAAALGTAGVAMAANAGNDEIQEVTPEDITGSATPDLSQDSSAHGTAPQAHGVNDSMSFNQAFAAARAEVGAGGSFEWHGRVYGTYYKTEWDSMSHQEKADYEARVFGHDGGYGSHHSVQNDSLAHVHENHVETHNHYTYNNHVDIHHHYEPEPNGAGNFTSGQEEFYAHNHGEDPIHNDFNDYGHGADYGADYGDDYGAELNVHIEPDYYASADPYHDAGELNATPEYGSGMDYDAVGHDDYSAGMDYGHDDYTADMDYGHDDYTADMGYGHDMGYASDYGTEMDQDFSQDFDAGHDFHHGDLS